MKKIKQNKRDGSREQAHKFLSILIAYFIRVKLFLDLFSSDRNLDVIVFTKLIPKNHLLVRIDSKIDFSFVNVLCKPYYKNSGVGNKAIEPVRIFKMLLVLVMYGILSERELERQVQVNVAFRQFCGFSLSDKIPDHSTLSVFRKRIGNETFKAIFVHILELCIKAKLVTNEMYIFDATLVKAHSSKISAKQQAINLYCAVIRTLFGETEPTNEQKETIAKQIVDKFKSTNTSQEKLQKRIDDLVKTDINNTILEIDNSDINKTVYKKPEKIISKKGKLADFIRLICDNIPHGIKDKCARFITVRSKKVLAYVLSLSVDGANLIITNFDFDKANISPQTKYIAMYEEHLERTKDCERKIPLSASADSEFDIDIEIRKRLLSDGVNCNIPIRKTGKKTDLFSSQEFFLKDDETLICPQNKEIKAVWNKKSEDITIFKGSECQSCQLKNKCTKAKYRTVAINVENFKTRQLAREYNKTEQYKSAMIQRMQIEGVFGLGKMYRHLDRCYYFDKEQNYNYAALFSTAHNILKLVLHS